MDFDNGLKQIGEFGRFQRKIFFLVNVLSFPVMIQMLVMVFLAAKPEWSCANGEDNSCTAEGHLCAGAKYTSNFTSIATEWNLVCSDSYKVELAQSIFMAGTLCGGPFLGSLADKYGRKKLWMVTYIGTCVFALLSAIATSYTMFVALRFTVGVFAGGAVLVMFVLTTESVGPSYRGFVSTFQQSFFSLYMMTLGGIAYLFRSWKLLSTVTLAPAVVQLLLFQAIPESPRWLASQGRYTEAEDIMHRAAIENGKTSGTRVTLSRAVQSKQQDSYGILDIFTHRLTCIYTLVISMLLFVNGMVYYGLSMNVKNLGGSLYLNFSLTAMVDLPSLIMIVVLISWTGRRTSLFFFMFGAATSCYTCMKLQDSINTRHSLLSATAMAGKFFISASFSLIYVYSSELLPTVVRNAGLGFSTIFSRVGGICSPFVVLLGEQYKSLPMLVFAVCAAVVGIIGLKLPETKGKPLPETFDDVDKAVTHKQAQETTYNDTRGPMI